MRKVRNSFINRCRL